MTHHPSPSAAPSGPAAYQAHYLQALNPAPGALKHNLLEELRRHLSLDLSDDALYARCKSASEDLLKEWRARKINPQDRDAVTRFYAETQLYLFELIALEIDATDYRQTQLKELAKFLRSQGKARGLDYGSGIGTLGLYLNRNGIQCDFADVSKTNLGFVRARLESRGLKAPRLTHLLTESLPAGGYDFVTAFDVLEHVTDPVGLIGEISSRLGDGGIFIFNLLCEEEEDTLHILRDLNPIRKSIRGFGLKKLTAFGEFKVYQKVRRPALVNSLLRGVDSAFWEFRETVRGLRPKAVKQP
jgi:2-polyprenyl-3-methyl-5-hydroxy-6-metoxy-1,4-benzoquinol methylase